MNSNFKSLFKSKFPKDLLNEIKWKGYDISKCKIYYVNRGSPGDISITGGNQIREIDRGFLVLEGIPFEKYIPLHRIVRIDYEDENIFDRKK